MAGEDPSSSPTSPRRVAYLTSRFPKLSETFILFEMDEVAKLGISIQLYALVRERPAVIHPEAERWLSRATFGGRMSRSIIGAQLYWLRRRPAAYLRAWAGALRMNLSSPRFLVRAFYIVPAGAFFARRMTERGTDHIHAHYATHPALAAWVAAKLTGLPYSITVHAHDLYVDSTGLDRKATDAAFVVAVSDYNRRGVLKLAPRAKVGVIRTGTDPTVFQPHARAEGGVLTIAAVGSLEPYKGHRHLVEACRILARGGRSFRCLIVGEGLERPELERLIQEGSVGTECELLGALPREGVRDVLASADVFVLPSITMPSGKMEGLPVVLMEAMAMELPVIASNLSGIPELVENGRTGLLVPEGDPDALAAAIAQLADDEYLRRKLGSQARATVEESFDLRRSARALATLFANPPKAA